MTIPPSIAPNLLDELMRLSPEGVVGHDQSGKVFLFNPSAERILGWKAEDVVGRRVAADLFAPGKAREAMAFLCAEGYGGQGRLQDFETDGISPDGRRVPVRITSAIVHERGGECFILGYFTDITARKAMEAQARESEEQYRGIIETATDAIVSFDEERTVTMANRAAEEMFRYDRAELIGMPFRTLLPEKYGSQWEQIERYVAYGASVFRKYVELSVLRNGGSEIPVQMSLAQKTFRGKRIVTAIVRDLTERKKFEEELRLLSITDALTGLYNRRHFHSLALKEIERAGRTRLPFSLILMDVDRFKTFNDTWGHAEGDRVLVQVAELIRKTFRTMDSAFRFGGEEFLVLMPETDSEGAVQAADRFRAELRAHPFVPRGGGEPLTLTVSVGVSRFTDGFGTDELIRSADLAMYTAKNGGRDRTVLYAPPPT